MESADKDLDRIISYCEKISSRQPDNAVYKDWLENIIYKFGITIFQTNLPDSTQISDWMNKKIFIVSNAMKSETIEKSDGLNYWFIKNITNIENEFIFIKFLHVLSQKYPRLEFVFISTSPFLFKDEFVLNVYNIKNIQSYADFVDIDDLSVNSEMKLLNLDDNGIYANNPSFINPNATALLKYNTISGIVFDIHFNSEISQEQLKDLIIQINSINSDL
jgi:hypothetical protein